MAEDPEELAREQAAPDAEESEDGGLVVISGDDEEEDAGPRSEIDQPDKLLRLAGQIRNLLSEVEAADLDEAGRARLADIHNRVLSELRGLVSSDLRDELDDMSLTGIEETPTGPELRVVQAQLGGWLEGLFHGIQASMASQQAAQQQQLMQQLQRQSGSSGQGRPSPGGGQYL